MPKMEGGQAERLTWLLSLVKPVPEEWQAERKAVPQGRTLEPEECRSWKVLLAAWRDALRMTDDVEVTLSVMMAVALSTEQQGDQQLFLQVISPPGSAKTRLCDAMLVSKHCHAIEHLTGFHSGFNDGSGEDFSLLARTNKKTWITPEGDVMMQNPRFPELMAQVRRIFDGTSSASYKNKKDEQKHDGLRTPWIIAGTPALLNVNQSSLGDRFMRIHMDPPGLDVRREILRRVALSSLKTVTPRSNCNPSSIIEGKMLKAYRLTGGYVDYLREQAGNLIGGIDLDEDEVGLRCAVLAEFVADCRARPDANAIRFKIGERHDTKEMPTRLTSQFSRLARCMAAVLQRGTVDDEVMRRVKKVAMDTARGHVLSIITKAWNLYNAGHAGGAVDAFARCIGEGDDRAETLLKFMRKLDMMESKNEGGVLRWRLTDRVRELCAEVL